MLRKALSYALTSVILLTQSGLPLHMHYCKGALESISIFFGGSCDDHDVASEMPACCEKPEGKDCSTKESSCCDDETKVLIQEFDSTTPHFDKWDHQAVVNSTARSTILSFSTTGSSASNSVTPSDTGPPIYILCSSLIYYA